MSSNIVISAETLRAASKEMDVPVTTLQGALSKFENALAALGKPWGDDEIGHQWSKDYEPGLKSFLDAMHSISGGLETLGIDLNAMAVLYELAEYGNQQ